MANYLENGYNQFLSISSINGELGTFPNETITSANADAFIEDGAIGGNTVKPFTLQDLDLTKPEDRKAYSDYRKKRDTGAVQINLNK